MSLSDANSNKPDIALNFRAIINDLVGDGRLSVKDADQLSLKTRTKDQLKWHPLELSAEELMQNPNGIVLVTGTTGSGKITTLYTSLKNLATEEVNVCTIEDPIKMVEPSFNQKQEHHNVDLSFADGERALLRQAPDIIIVGETRDLETANIDIQAATL